MRTYRPRVVEIKKKLQRAIVELDKAAYPIPTTMKAKSDPSGYVLDRLKKAAVLVDDAERAMFDECERGEEWYHINVIERRD